MNRKIWNIPLVHFVIIILSTILVSLIYFGVATYDTQDYLNIINFFRGAPFIESSSFRLTRPLLLIIVAFLGGSSFIFALINVVFWILTVLFLYQFFIITCNENKEFKALFGVIFFNFSYFMAVGSNLLTESITTFFCIIFLYFIVKFPPLERVRNSIYLGLVISLGFLAKEFLIFFYFPMVLLVIFLNNNYNFKEKTKHLLISFGIAIIIPLIYILLIGINNYLAFLVHPHDRARNLITSVVFSLFNGFHYLVIFAGFYFIIYIIDPSVEKSDKIRKLPLVISSIFTFIMFFFFFFINTRISFSYLFPLVIYLGVEGLFKIFPEEKKKSFYLIVGAQLTFNILRNAIFLSNGYLVTYFSLSLIRDTISIIFYFSSVILCIYLIIYFLKFWKNRKTLI